MKGAFCYSPGRFSSIQSRNAERSRSAFMMVLSRALARISDIVDWVTPRDAATLFWLRVRNQAETTAACLGVQARTQDACKPAQLSAKARAESGAPRAAIARGFPSFFALSSASAARWNAGPSMDPACPLSSPTSIRPRPRAKRKRWGHKLRFKWKYARRAGPGLRTAPDNSSRPRVDSNGAIHSFFPASAPCPSSVRTSSNRFANPSRFSMWREPSKSATTAQIIGGRFEAPRPLVCWDEFIGPETKVEKKKKTGENRP